MTLGRMLAWTFDWCMSDVAVEKQRACMYWETWDMGSVKAAGKEGKTKTSHSLKETGELA